MTYTKSTREQILSGIIETETYLNKIQDVDVLMESILTEARKVVHADAGRSTFATATGSRFIMPRTTRSSASCLPDRKSYILFSLFRSTKKQSPVIVP